VSTPAELRIATRIHFGLKHLLGEGIDVETMLKQPEEAREILFVCQASGNAELVALAAEFELARAPKPKARPATAVAKPAKRGAVPQDLACAQDSSGFGLTLPPEPVEKEAPRRRHALGWLRLGS